MHRWRRVLDRMKDADIQGFFFYFMDIGSDVCVLCSYG